MARWVGVGEAGPVGAERAVGAVEVVAGEAIEEAAGGEVEVEAILHRMARVGVGVGGGDGLEDEDGVFHIDDEDGPHRLGGGVSDRFHEGPAIDALRLGGVVDGDHEVELALGGGETSGCKRIPFHFGSGEDDGLAAAIGGDGDPFILGPAAGEHGDGEAGEVEEALAQRGAEDTERISGRGAGAGGGPPDRGGGGIEPEWNSGFGSS
jgi:hypothetical protein